ncbi:DUF6787 family protein [Roseivirga sp. UBA1976]|uniref:DUF6787 domain-containing protein n=2 Tax=Roseivirgaceae TaxID=2762306 RepID=A0ABQ3I6X4_9BACT|nr:DUF6787 family protein [Roseivirga sp. UBA1976]GHE55954.1 hypothetical protein GCM10011340_08440 [Roseivirga thermotolerans]|tara:strand:+ start:1819 stop:2142 length:324 start_codon:yes stop_codon:yes gene_type:complete
MSQRSFLEKMQNKWGLNSIFQTVMVLIVFAFTGSTVLFLKPFIFDLVGFEHITGFWGVLLYIVLIFPLYQVLILIYGFIFGQFAFFWNWEKQFVQRMGRLFKKRDKN